MCHRAHIAKDKSQHLLYVEEFIIKAGNIINNTPVGHYNPDWAVVFHERSDIKHIYFVAEMKGYEYDKDSLKDYRRAESVKIECASRHFATISDSHVTYDVVKNYDELWDIITKL